MLKKLKKYSSEMLNAEKSLEELNIDESELEKLKDDAHSMDEQDIQKNQKHFSEKNFWKKVKNISIKSGSSISYVVLLLYYTMNKPEVPLSIKATIAGALGYFILPFDLIPDVAAGVGYADDLAVLTAALFQVVIYIDEDIKQQAKDKLNVLFGDDINTTEVDEKLSDSNKSVE